MLKIYRIFCKQITSSKLPTYRYTIYLRYLRYLYNNVLVSEKKNIPHLRLGFGCVTIIADLAKIPTLSSININFFVPVGLKIYL
jgi:hypothetical protein